MYEREGATCVAFTVVAPIFFKANSGVGLNSKLRARDKQTRSLLFPRSPLVGVTENISPCPRAGLFTQTRARGSARTLVKVSLLVGQLSGLHRRPSDGSDFTGRPAQR